MVRVAKLIQAVFRFKRILKQKRELKKLESPEMVRVAKLIQAVFRFKRILKQKRALKQAMINSKESNPGNNKLIKPSAQIKMK